jgi:hypothetical protein
MAKKNNSTANLLGKVLSQKATTPIQENKNGIIKPIEKTFLLPIPAQNNNSVNFSPISPLRGRQ